MKIVIGKLTVTAAELVEYLGMKLAGKLKILDYYIRRKNYGKEI